MLYEKEVLNILNKYDKSRQNILYILKELQDKDSDNQVKEEYAKIISKEMNINLAEIYEIITFYSMFNANKQGKYIIEVCTSGPCYVTKSKVIVEHLKKRLGIDIGQTTKDYRFTLKSCSCIGSCDISPVIKIGEEVYGHLTIEKVDEIIKSLL